VLKAHDIAMRDSNALTLYLIGNHYSPAMRPENLRFGAPLKGGSPDDVKHPPKVQVGKAHANTPFRWLPPPTDSGLDALRDQIEAFVENNLAHEKKEGQKVLPKAKETITVRLDDLFQMMKLAASAVESFGDWLIRVQHDLFQRMLGDEASRIVFLPMRELTDLLRPELPTLAVRAARVPGLEMPPKFLLTSVPAFRGIGDPSDGYRKARLLRALLEMEPPALATALRAPWEKDPEIRSDLLPE